MRQVTLKIKSRTKRFGVTSKDDWGKVVKYLAGHLKPGDVVALSGTLGAGKTTLVQALAKELGIKRLPQSPTFSLLRSYAVPRDSRYGANLRRLIHVDAYRLKDERELMVLDLDEELASPGSFLLVEWPENIVSWLKKYQNKVIIIKIDIDR